MKELLNSKKTAFIASISEENLPQVSYAPYILINDKMYIYISKVAEHYKNLENNKNVSVMVIEDETNSPILFARKRLTFKGEATKLSQVCDDIKTKFEEIHSKNMMEVLYKMDFDFFEIQLIEGRLVEGFGKAFKLTYNSNKNEWEQEHIVIDKAHNK